jgi:phage recombination protein Bet
MNAVATIQPSRLPISPAIAKEFELQPTEWRVLVDQIFPAAKSVEAVMMALAYCRKRNLDIFKKPVHIVPMWSSAKKAMVETVWPGIAEIRTTAARTGEYAGIDAVEFGPMVERSFTGDVGSRDRQETVTKKVRFPEWASVVVYRMIGGERCAYHAKVFWEETYATVGKSEVPNDMWAKRPRGQLDKCVEAAALRKAFPEELGNTYAAEEMEGRTIEGEHVAAPQPPKPPAPPALPSAAARPSDIVDVETIDHVADGIDADPPEEPFDASAFFEEMETSLGAETTAAGIEERWTEFDAMAQFDGDETNQAIALAIKKRALKRVGGGNG